MTAATPGRRPSVYDVAKLAGVSTASVSHVLNRPSRVSEATRVKVLRVIDELGYVRLESARQLRAGRSNLVGVLVHDISNPFFTEEVRGIEDRLRPQGLIPVIGSTDFRKDTEKEFLTELASMDVMGIILAPSEGTFDNLPIVTDRGTRVVLTEYPDRSRGLPTVAADDVAGARVAITHLLDLGHRRIGFVNGPLDVRQAADRRRGAREAVAAAGLDPEAVISEVDTAVEGRGFTTESGQSGAVELLDAHPDLTALLCANDRMAIGAMREVRRRGMSVPTDVSVVGYDDIGVASSLLTPLTTVRIPMREIGRAAADLLLNASQAIQHVSFTPELVVRESTAPVGEQATN